MTSVGIATRTILAFLLLVVAPVARAQTYSALDLGTLGGDTAFPASMRGAYIVGGSLMKKAAFESAFLYDASQGMVALPDLGGGAVAFDVNSNGVAVGLSTLPDQTTEFAVEWQKGQVIDIGSFNGSNYSVAMGCNNNGQVVGNGQVVTKSIDGDLSLSYHAFLWQQNTKIVDAGLLPGGTYSLFNAVNANGEAVGSADTVKGSGAKAIQGEHAIRWDQAHGLHDLGTLGGRNSVARAINANGEIVGASDTASGEQHAFLWSPISGMQDLGVISGYDSTVASSINDSGLVTGGAYDSQGHRFGGFVWDSLNGMRDINDLVPSSLGFILYNIVGVDSGLLSAAGDDGDSAQDVILLSPTD